MGCSAGVPARPGARRRGWRRRRRGWRSRRSNAMAEDKYHRELAAGQWLFREGDPGDCAFVIESGSVLVFRERQGERLPLATLKAGDLIGEMSLIDQLPRSAS